MLTPTISGVRLSSVVPAEVTAEENRNHKLTNIDLALKLHYITGVYLFKEEAMQGLTIQDFKKPMFPWLHLFYTTSGRIRRSEDEKPFIKCNDSGVRIVEAYCDQSLEEFMAIDYHHRNYSSLAYDQVLGPDLGFSPLVYIQFTFFKCGGLSVGLSWAHVLGDIYSASAFINMWGQFTQGHVPLHSLHVPPSKQPDHPPSPHKKPSTIKRVDPVEDYWLTTSNCKMETHCFNVPANQLNDIASQISGLIKPAEISHFEVISAMIWKSLSNIREDLGPKIATICSRISSKYNENEFPSNNRMVISTVEADFSVAKGGVDELAAMIANKLVNENGSIEETVASENGDYITYGANLTFVDLKEADIYGLKLKGHKPTFVNYTIKGVGDEGAVLVLPGQPEDGGNTVTVILPGYQVSGLKNQLRKEWGIV